MFTFSSDVTHVDIPGGFVSSFVSYVNIAHFPLLAHLRTLYSTLNLRISCATLPNWRQCDVNGSVLVIGVAALVAFVCWCVVGRVDEIDYGFVKFFFVAFFSSCCCSGVLCCFCRRRNDYVSV